MSKVDSKSNKRKGASEPSVTTKKVKTTIVEKPAPKSALKKTETAKPKKEVESTAASTRPSRSTRKRAEDFLEPEEKPVKKTTVKVAPGKVEKVTVTESVKPAAESASSKVSKAKAKAAPKAVVEEEEIALANESDSEAEAEEDDQTAALLAGFESSDDENDPQDDGIALEKLPAVPNMKEVRKQLKDAQQDDENTPGVVYIGRLPHGFFEAQMREYFSQFGDITHLRMARNKLTGRSKHYAFIEFASGAVAEIVAKTMDKYLLFGHLLQVRRIPAEQVHEKLWKGEGGRFKVMPRNKIEGGMLKRGTTREGWEKRIERENEARSKKAAQLKELGYEFEMPALRDVKEVATKEVREAEAAPLITSADVTAVLNKEEEQPEEKETKKTTPVEKAGAKRVKGKADGKKTSKKAKVSA
ncbi:RNA-binding domain-containing protein [Aureobasidium pullulans]|uniref:RNA-binding domain-containing protein n=1 Tax=Aureobasidium pullulans TaxID=5580 RepID=A0A4S9AJP2_AURPU|nr:RNA-binding domain-containing protein [Aureobasidium pullulans]